MSDDLIRQDAKAVFFMMAGSWFVDWDSTDNIMRAALATPSLSGCFFESRDPASSGAVSSGSM